MTQPRVLWFLKSNAKLQKMSPDEAKLFRLYGKLPNKKDLLQNKLKVRCSRAIL